MTQPLYSYVSVAQQIRNNAERHLANAVGYASRSNFSYCDGSMRKALRNFKRADEIDIFFSWSHTEHAVSFECSPISDLLHQRMNAAIATMRDDMTRSLYGDGTGASLQIFRRNRLRAFLDRLHSAWLVLIGRVEIY